MSRLTIGTEMTRNLVTIKGSEPVAEAYRIMFSNKIRHLPVLDRNGNIEGIISDRDVQRAMVSEVSDGFGFKLESVKFRDNSKVLDYMTWPVKTYEDDTDVREVLQSMLDKKVSAFLITKKGEVVGIVTTDDMLWLLRNLLDGPNEEAEYSLGEVLTSPLFSRITNMVSDAGI